MRVLHIVTAFPRNPKDLVSHWLVEMLRRLQAAGVDVEVFTSAYKGATDHVHAGITVRRFRYFPTRWENLTHEEAAPDRMRRSLLYRIIAVFFVLSGMLSIWRLCRRERYDIIHVHWPLPLALLGWVARAASGAPIVTTFYGVELRLASSGFPLFERFLGWAARQSERVVAISSHTAAELRRIAAVPIDVIPYGIGMDAIPARTAESRERAGCSVLFVGRLVERKGVAYLIQALRHLPPGLGTRLVIVGDGPERARLEEIAREQEVSERVEFWGMVSHDTLRVAYSSADMFVLPSVIDSRGDTEGLGVVLLEAMSHGMPVIATNVGGITDIVRDNVTGLLVPPNDALALAEAIRRLADDPRHSTALAEAGYRHAHDHFSWDSITARWRKLYAEVMAAGARG